MFAFPALGLKSEDLLRGDKTTATHALKGHLWRFAGEELPPSEVQDAFSNTSSGGPNLSSLPPDAPSLQMRRAEVGQPPIVKAPVAPVVTQQAQPQSTAQGKQVATSEKFTKEQLDAAKPEELKKLAASLGIANVDQPKDKLVSAILGSK